MDYTKSKHLLVTKCNDISSKQNNVSVSIISQLNSILTEAAARGDFIEKLWILEWIKTVLQQVIKEFCCLFTSLIASYPSWAYL
jgi:hypothetical protein